MQGGETVDYHALRKALRQTKEFRRRRIMRIGALMLVVLGFQVGVYHGR